MIIRKDDKVVVTTGDDKSPEVRTVVRVLPEKGKIVVQGVNLVYKHKRATGRNQPGGRLSVEMPIDASNVMLFCPACNKGVRVGHRFNSDGRKERYCRKCQNGLGTLGPAKPNRTSITTKG